MQGQPRWRGRDPDPGPLAPPGLCRVSACPRDLPPFRGALQHQAAHTPTLSPLSRHRAFFFQRSNFRIPVSPESWGPEAVLSLGAVPWQRRFLSEPDFCSWAGFASSPSQPQEKGASPLPASASGSKQTPSPFCCPSPGHCMLSVLSLSSAIFSFCLPPLLHLFRVSHSLRKDG